jgi:hypothetical protein
MRQAKADLASPFITANNAIVQTMPSLDMDNREIIVNISL